MQLDISLKKTIGSFQLNAQCRITGQRTGLFGPSGSGKSTLLHLLAGMDHADRGHIRLGDDILFDSVQKINLKPEQRRIGVVFQQAHLFPHMSVRRNLLYGWNRTRKDRRLINPETLFSVLGIEHLLKRKVMALSGGERQRIALARTVLTCPRLILMDEPLNGLDEELKFQIIPYLNRVFTEFSIPLLFISHSMLEMRLMTEDALVMEKGRLGQQLPTEELAGSLWNNGRRGFVNLLRLGRSNPHRDLYSYQWGETNLILTDPGKKEKNFFELNATDIILFKRHPEATSARNLLQCRVQQLNTSGNRVRVELACGSTSLIAQIVPESLRELGIQEGCRVIAAIKASSFRPLF